jgi:hypothetical protein
MFLKNYKNNLATIDNGAQRPFFKEAHILAVIAIGGHGFFYNKITCRH